MPAATDRLCRRRFLAGTAASLVGASVAEVAEAAISGAGAAALVVGSSSYSALPHLPHAATDARLVGAAFRGVGMNVDTVTNADRATLMLALARFRVRARQSDVAAFFYAGHGLRIDGSDLLVPIDFEPERPEFSTQTVPVSVVLQAVSERPRVKILFIDACRTVPDLHDSTSGTGAPIGSIASFAPAGTHITYASEPGKIAYDGRQGASPFARALVRALRRPWDEIDVVARNLRRDVILETGGRQVPWTQSSLLSRVTIGRAPRW